MSGRSALPLPGFVVVDINWPSSPSKSLAIIAEQVTDHMVIHPSVVRSEDCEGCQTDTYRFLGTWKVTHAPSGLSACPYESLETVEAAREWARTLERFPDIDLDATDRDMVMARVDATALWDAWHQLRAQTWASLAPPMSKESP